MAILLVSLAIVILAAIFLYNQLVKLRVLTENAWADISVQLKRRHDLVPNLVNTVKGYASHEASTLQSVVDARTRAIGVQNPSEASKMEGLLSGALKTLFAVAENYPALRASENFQQLQSSLDEIEEAIQNSRRYYNAVVRDFNTKTEQFPSNLVASTLGFETKSFFELDRGEAAVPTVDFSEP